MRKLQVYKFNTKHALPSQIGVIVWWDVDLATAIQNKIDCIASAVISQANLKSYEEDIQLAQEFDEDDWEKAEELADDLEEY